tara:strand:- start:1858 stop:2913 length:1056 start_codon:yes stop_codon:yes gene_type:complete
MNKNIVEEFSHLIVFVEENIKKNKEEGNKKDLNVNNFRIRQLKNIFKLIKNYPDKITIDNYLDLKNIDGIGKGTLDRIKEILETKKLSELDDFKKTFNVKDFKNETKIVEELSEVIGIGPSNAKDFFKKGIKGIDDLNNKIKNKKIEVNEKILLGLKYYGVYKVNIPRQEIDKIYKLLNKVIKKINKKNNLDDSNKYIFEVCGSYRREKPFSNDIDVLITKLGDDTQENHLKSIVEKLKKPIKENENKEFLVDDITDKNIETKYMGFSKYKDNPIRRIDIRFISYTSYFFALLYFTGSMELNKKMRELAKSKNLKLSEYGLFDEKNKSFKAKSEKDIFKKLGMEYLPPRFR